MNESVEDEWRAMDSMVSNDLLNEYTKEIEEAESLNQVKLLVRQIFKDDRINDEDYNELMDNQVLNKFIELGYEFPEDESTYEIITKEVDDFMGSLEDDRKVKDVLGYELQDDDTPYGGTSFAGETVADFIGYDEETGEFDDSCSVKSLDEDLTALNKDLVACGIKPIVVE